MSLRIVLICAALLPLCACGIRIDPPLTSDNFRHTSEQQADFVSSFAHCRADTDEIMTRAAPPQEAAEYREWLNAGDHTLIRCMAQHGYAFRPKEELLVPWHD